MAIESKVSIKTLDRFTEHWQESQEHFSMDNIVGLFLQGSQNYGLDTEDSDVDTKLVVTPTLSDIVMNRSPVSTTHVRENDEHIDFKDIRLMLHTFRKQNINFLEILFTKVSAINSMYAKYWSRLVEHREEIAHYNVYAAVKAQKGVALEKYHAMEHRYPSRIAFIDKYGYDPKQLHHLLRVKTFLADYTSGKPYEECLIPSDKDYLISVKKGIYSLEEAREVANKALADIEEISSKYTKDSEYNKNDLFVEELLNSVQEDIMVRSIKRELVRKELKGEK